MKIAKASAALLIGAISAIANAAPTHYSFDTVTAVNLDGTVPSISGVLVNTTSPVTVTFVDQTNISYRYVVNRCVPLFLTAMEKPGRYVLRITVDPAVQNVQLVGCRLELKN
jgi:hypothetical protein